MQPKQRIVLSKHSWLYAGIVALVGMATPAPPVQAQTTPLQSPTVVELFTSQGCSSCPPADRILGELSTMPNVIALAFHVDYWNSLGWRDRFSLPIAVERQRGYVRAMQLASAFTPQAVIDGRSSAIGSDKRRILAAAANPIDDAVPVVLVVSDGALTISLPEMPARHKYAIFLAAYLPEASTSIARGENSGSTLQEFNIVREFRDLGSWSGHASDLHVPLQSLPSDASRVAVILQSENQGPIVGGATAAVR